jgi:hypothetical protein
MKHIIFLLFIFVYNTTKAESFDKLTVVAKSGCHIRAEAKYNSEKIALIPCGAIVNCEKYTTPTKRIMINGISGFWIKVFYNDLQGYIFSAYLLPEIAEWEKPKKKDYIVLPLIHDFSTLIPKTEKNIFQAKFFNADYYWYAIKYLEGRTIIKPIEITVSYNSYLEQVGDGPDEVERKDFFFYTFKNKSNFDQIIASKEKLSSSKNKSSNLKMPLINHSYPNPSSGNDYNFKKREYKYHIKSIVINDNSSAQYDEKTFQSLLEINNKMVKTIYKGSQMVFFDLLWHGDINNDGLLDFIFKETSHFDCCGCHPYKRILISKKSQEGIEYNFTNDFW